MPIWKDGRPQQQDFPEHLCLWQNEQSASPWPLHYGKQTSHVVPFSVTGVCSAGTARGWESASIAVRFLRPGDHSCEVEQGALSVAFLKYSPECNFCH